MKKKLLIVLTIVIGIYFISVNQLNNKKDTINDDIEQLHAKNLSESPFKENLNLSKKERKAKGLTPNKYYESEWELTMNPTLGRPTPENLRQIRQELLEQRQETRAQGRVPGDFNDNSWVERGPNNVGGRTRAVMFDPNDTTNETVFAGGVSGGLWKNTNISNASSTWTRVDVPENLAVSSITSDPNNSNIFYLGTGEAYVFGDVNGDGVWKSEDGGITWANIFGGISGPTTFESASNITVNTPASIAGDYLSFPTTAFGSEITAVITADIVLVDDGTGAPTEACNALINGSAINGNIALIRRANCNFTVKVKNAQDAGAVGVIMMNNIDGEPVPMGGTDASITIPSVMISKADGDILENTLASSTINGSLNPSSGTFTGLLVPGLQHINDIKVRNNGGVSEIYVAAGDGFYRPANATTFLGGPELGLYKSIDGGLNWNEVTLPLTANGNKHSPNDIEIGADNTIWVSTINSYVFGDGGGIVFSSADGITFEQKYEVADGDRTQIAVSSSDAGKVYILAELSAGTVTMINTTSSFDTGSINTLELPNDADNDIPADDFTRNQAFYNLMLEVDPDNDNSVYTGGIDLFKSVDSGTNWDQISKWSNNNNLSGLNVPLVHADQHILAFANGSSSRMVFGNDGGVYFSNDSGTTIQVRNNGFITSQFYTVGVGPTTAFTGDYFAGGLQDNGTQFFENANPTTPDSSVDIYGGDGAYTFFDQDGTDRYYIRNFVYNSGINLYNLDTDSNVTINSENESNGSFINPCALDSNLDILYTNYSSGANVIIRRYAGIKSSSTLVKTNLTDPDFDSRPTAFTVSPYRTTSSTLLVGTVLGDIFKVENADGATPIWTNLELANIIVGSVSDIEFGATENDIFVTIHNYGVQNIWYTSDGGSTWLTKEGNLPDLPVKAILQSPLNSDEVIIGTELGVWFTKDFSSVNPTWNQAYNGMSNVKVTDLDVRDDNIVFASTYGRGVFSGAFSLDPAEDIDGDGVLNGVDNCPDNANADQADIDNNGIGDVCQDLDNDTILDINDNCPDNSNIDQLDTDNNGVGDACQDTDGDTILDIDDNCIDISNVDQQDTNGNGSGDVCDTSYANPENITLEVISETCEGQNNGKVNVKVNEVYVTYTVTLVGNGLNLTEQITTNSHNFTDIPVGSYTVCVSVNEFTYEQCFEINIDASEVIDISAVNNEDDLDVTSITVNRGTAPFTVLFNNKVVRVTNEHSFDIETIGSGLLEVKTSKACEGIFEMKINNSFKFIASPNPVIDNLRISIPSSISEEQINAYIFDVSGKLLWNQVLTKQNSGFIDISFSSLSKGVYFVKLNLERPEIFKIIKK